MCYLVLYQTVSHWNLQLLPPTALIDQLLSNGCPVVQPIDTMIYRWLNANPKAACKEIVEAMNGGTVRFATEAKNNIPKKSGVFFIRQG